MLRWFHKRRALRSYRRKLAPELIARYGHQPQYSIKQVQLTAHELKLDPDYLCYAFADFCSLPDFDAYHAAMGQACDWEAMRHELDHTWGLGHHPLATVDLDAGHHDAGDHHDVGIDPGHHGGDFGGFDGGGHH
jgi:hypothetical protein